MTSTTRQRPSEPRPTRRPGRCPCSPSSAGPTSASRPWSTGSSAAARRSSRTCPASPATGSPTTPTGTAAPSPSSTPAAGTPTPAGSPSGSPARPRSPSRSPTRCSSSSTRRSASPTPTRPSSRSCASPASRSCWPPTRSTTQRTEAEAYGLWNLGLGEPWPGLGAARPRLGRHARRHPRRAAGAAARSASSEVGGPRRIAIVGRPNVGKSSLLNKLAGEDRVVVDDVAGTTVDPVDELVELGGRTWRFIDTAGIRKRVKEASGHEYYASLRTTTAIDRAEVAVLVLDAIAVGLRAGRADHPDRPRGRPGAGHRLQQVGPRRRGAPLLPRPRDRARPRPGAVGAADQRHRAHRLARRPARARRSTGRSRAGRRGSAPAPSTPSSAGWSPSTRTRSAAASSPRSSSAPSRRRRRRRSCCSPAASSRRRTSGTSSAGCARTSASWARRS